MRNKNSKGYLIAMDLDGVLCSGECWSPADAITATPIKENIDLLYKLIHAGHHIVIYTARKEWWRPATEMWLKENQVPYHALIMGNLPADFYVNDKNISLEELKKIYHNFGKNV